MPSDSILRQIAAQTHHMHVKFICCSSAGKEKLARYLLHQCMPTFSSFCFTSIALCESPSTSQDMSFTARCLQNVHNMCVVRESKAQDISNENNSDHCESLVLRAQQIYDLLVLRAHRWTVIG